MDLNVPRKDRGYAYPGLLVADIRASGTSEHKRAVALTRLLLAGERELAQALGLLPDGDEPGWAPGPALEAGLRRLGVVA